MEARSTRALLSQQNSELKRQLTQIMAGSGLASASATFVPTAVVATPLADFACMEKQPQPLLQQLHCMNVWYKDPSSAAAFAAMHEMKHADCADVSDEEDPAYAAFASMLEPAEVKAELHTDCTGEIDEDPAYAAFASMFERSEQMDYANPSDNEEDPAYAAFASMFTQAEQTDYAEQNVEEQEEDLACAPFASMFELPDQQPEKSELPESKQRIFDDSNRDSGFAILPSARLQLQPQQQPQQQQPVDQCAVSVPGTWQQSPLSQLQPLSLPQPTSSHYRKWISKRSRSLKRGWALESIPEAEEEIEQHEDIEAVQQVAKKDMCDGSSCSSATLFDIELSDEGSEETDMSVPVAHPHCNLMSSQPMRVPLLLGTGSCTGAIPVHRSVALSETKCRAISRKRSAFMASSWQRWFRSS